MALWLLQVPLHFQLEDAASVPPEKHRLRSVLNGSSTSSSYDWFSIATTLGKNNNEENS